MAVRTLLACTASPIAEDLRKVLLPWDVAQREVAVDKPSRISTYSGLVRREDLHVQDHRSRDITSEQSKACIVVLSKLKCPAGDQNTKICQSREKIQGLEMQSAGTLAMLLDVPQTDQAGSNGHR